MSDLTVAKDSSRVVRGNWAPLSDESIGKHVGRFLKQPPANNALASLSVSALETAIYHHDRPSSAFSGFAPLPLYGGAQALDNVPFTIVTLSNEERWFIPHEPRLIKTSSRSASEVAIDIYSGSRFKNNLLEHAFLETLHKANHNLPKPKPPAKYLLEILESLPPPESLNYRGPTLHWREPQFRSHHLRFIVPWSKDYTDLPALPSQLRATCFGHSESHALPRGTPRYHLSLDDQIWRSTIDVNKLRVGDVMAYEYPFQWVSDSRRGRILTTGSYVQFPSTRPSGEEWENNFNRSIRFARAISAKEWGTFLKALEGCYLEGVLPSEGVGYSLQVIKRRMKELQSSTDGPQSGLSKQSTDPKHCFNAPPDNEHRVEIGENLIFVLARKNAEPLYLVDAPRVCALYVFRDRESAFHWAAREITFEMARRLCCYWTPHSDGWAPRINRWLSSEGVKGV